MHDIFIGETTFLSLLSSWLLQSFWNWIKMMRWKHSWWWWYSNGYFFVVCVTYKSFCVSYLHHKIWFLYLVAMVFHSSTSLWCFLLQHNIFFLLFLHIFHLFVFKVFFMLHVLVSQKKLYKWIDILTICKKNLNFCIAFMCFICYFSDYLAVNSKKLLFFSMEFCICSFFSIRRICYEVL